MAKTRWSDVVKEATGFEPLPVGDYDTEVTSATHKVSSNGKDMYNVEFTVTAGPHEKRKAWRNFVVSPDNPNAMGMFFSQMAALGLPREFWQEDPSDGQICQGLVGAKARITVAHREWEGRVQSDVKKVVPLKGSAVPSPTTSSKPVEYEKSARPEAPF